MIGKYFIKSFFHKTNFILFGIINLYLLFQLYRYKTQYVDTTIVISNTYCLSINLYFLVYIIYRNKRLSQNLNHILIRLSKDELIQECIKCIFMETISFIIFVYVFPLLIFRHIYHLSVYFIYIILLFISFLFYQLIELSAIFCPYKITHFILLILPFIINLSLQIYFLNTLYERIGGFI